VTVNIYILNKCCSY